MSVQTQHWKSIIAILIMPLAFLLNYIELYFAILFLIWSIQGLKKGNIFLLDNIEKSKSPLLFWVVTLTWLILSLLSLIYSEPFI